MTCIPDIEKIPKYFSEKGDICTLVGSYKGEQCFMQQFADSKKKIKIIKGGGNFYIGDKREYNVKKSEIYKKIGFNKRIIDCLPTVVAKTLGVHLRYSDGCFRRNPLKKEIVLAEIERFITNHTVENIIIVSDMNNKKKDMFEAIKDKYPKINIVVSLVKNTSRKKGSGLQQAMVDWLTLTRCDHLIFTTGSSFGYESYAFDRNKIVSEIPNAQLMLGYN
jgi:hypothetical protein